jgi:uncharacterized protein YneF (UPF0154 family)
MDAVLSLVLKFLLVAAAAGGVFVAKKYFYTKDENIVEEMIEFHIKDQVGIDVDLTPESPENAREARRRLQIIKRNELIQPID